MTVLAWVVPLALFWGVWFAFMRFIGAPITWLAVSAVASIMVLVFALQQRMWWLAVPAAIAMIVLVPRGRQRS